MRTSNKILITSLALLIISLAFYDLRLKAEYQKAIILTLTGAITA